MSIELVNQYSDPNSDEFREEELEIASPPCKYCGELLYVDLHSTRVLLDREPPSLFCKQCKVKYLHEWADSSVRYEKARKLQATEPSPWRDVGEAFPEAHRPRFSI